MPAARPSVLTRLAKAARAVRIPRAHLAAHLILAAAAFYTFVLATHLTFGFEHLRAMDHYRYQANGFAAGYLELFDDSGNPLPAILDSCNYRGKAYIGYGLLPAVFQLVLRNGLHLNVTSAAIVWMLCLLTLYLLYWTAHDLGRHVLGLDQGRAALAAAALCAGVALTRQFLHQAVVPYSWSQAGAAGQLFTMLAVWMVLRRHVTGRARYAALAGFFTGCAAFSKANFAFVAAPVFLWLLFDRPEGVPRLAWSRRIAVQYGLPLAAVVGCIMTVNAGRFGSPFEIGFRFANTDERNPAEWGMPRLGRVPYNLYNHFLAPFRWSNGDLPVLEGRSQRFGFINFKDGSGGLLHNVPLFSMFLAVPLLALVPLDGLRAAAAWIRRRRLDPYDRWWWFFVSVGAFAFGIYLMHDSSWLRYQYDLLFCGALAVLISVVRAARFLSRPGLTAAAAIMGAAGVWHGAVGLDHSLGLLFSRTQPFMYWHMSAWRPSDEQMGARVQMVRAALFGPDIRERVFFETDTSSPPANRHIPGAVWHVRKPGLWFRSDGFEWIHLAGKWLDTPATVTFPAAPGAAEEPLYAVGKDHITADSVRVRYGPASPGRLPVTLLASHAGLNKPCESAEIGVVPGKAYRMAFVLDPVVGQVAVSLDGEEVLYCRMDFFGDGASPVSFGRDPDGHRTFSGTIVPEGAVPD